MNHYHIFPLYVWWAMKRWQLLYLFSTMCNPQQSLTSATNSIQDRSPISGHLSMIQDLYRDAPWSYYRLSHYKWSHSQGPKHRQEPWYMLGAREWVPWVNFGWGAQGFEHHPCHWVVYLRKEVTSRHWDCWLGDIQEADCAFGEMRNSTRKWRWNTGFGCQLHSYQLRNSG